MATIPASDNEFPEVKFAEGAAPGTPASGLVIAYAKSDGLLYSKDDAGAETALGAAAHIADTTDAHDASAVSFDPTGLSNVTGTEVQTAIEELDAAVAAGGIPATIFDNAMDMIYASAADTAAKLAAPSANGYALQRLAGALAWAYPPGYELDYAQLTSNQTPTATSEATANTLVTGTAVTYDGSTVVMIEFWAPNARPDTGAAGRTQSYVLYEDGASIGLLGIQSSPVNSQSMNTAGLTLRRRLTPSAGSHTYSIRAFVNAGTGLVAAGTGGSGAPVPCFMRIVKA